MSCPPRSHQHYPVPPSPIHSHLSLDPNNLFPIPVSQGVPQGSPCSPILFNILIDPVVRHLLRFNPSVLLQLFADDTTLLSDNYDHISHSISMTEKLFALIGLQINHSKSALLHLDPDRPPPLPTNWQTCPRVTRFKHLGIWVGPNVSLLDIYAEAIDKLELRCSTYSPRTAPFHDRILIWNIYVLPVLSYIMRFHSLLQEQVSRIIRAAKRLLDPHHLLPIRNLLGDKQNHPFLSPPIPFHPVFFAKRQSVKTGTLFPSHYPTVTHLTIATFTRKIEKFITPPYSLHNFNIINQCKGRLPHTYQLIILNGLFIYARVHHYWEDFPSHCRLCRSEKGDNWPHMLSQCTSIIQTTRLLSHLDQTLYRNFSSTLNDALMFSQALKPENILNHLVLIHSIWVTRYLSSITHSGPTGLLALFWTQRAKAIKQGLLKSIRRAHLAP